MTINIKTISKIMDLIIFNILIKKMMMIKKNNGKILRITIKMKFKKCSINKMGPIIIWRLIMQTILIKVKHISMKFFHFLTLKMLCKLLNIIQ